MARPQMVTRTFTTTIAKILAVKVSTQETEIVEVTLPRTYKSNEEILKVAQKSCANPDTRYVHVIEATQQDKLYGMMETEFLQYAKELPPRTAKESDNDTQYADTDSVETN